LLFLLMFCGACAGSTGGGIKVSRFLIVGKSVKKELGSYVHPRSVKKIQMDDKPIEHDVMRSVNVYFATFMAVYVISVILVSIEGYSFGTNLSAVAATINNIGPGFELVGPTCNFGFFNPFSKVVLIFDMLAGRLELFPMLILLYPAIWRSRVRKLMIQN
ncbi:MAG: potassium transporter TrkG, partial [Acutalibacteraceae bacterium]|nr:potassium transporter TrkG [Acutalibacteraceae bacterium]